MIEYIQLVTALILIGSLVVAIFQLRLLRKQIKAEHDWNRRVTALKYSFSESPSLRAIRSRLEHNLQIFTRRPGEITLEEIERLEREKYPNIRADIQFVLGRLASMCAAINNQIIDEKVCKDLMQGTVISFYRFFRQYIEDVRKLRNNKRIYECLEFYALKWEQQETNLKKREPTG